MAKCSPCHAGNHSGRHDIAVNYADALKDVDSLTYDDCWTGSMDMPVFKKVGQCAAILARKGLMPYPATPMDRSCELDPSQSRCTTPAQQDTLDAWVAAGMPQ
jgi:hypothetical protein